MSTTDEQTPTSGAPVETPAADRAPSVDETASAGADPVPPSGEASAPPAEPSLRDGSAGDPLAEDGALTAVASRSRRKRSSPRDQNPAGEQPDAPSGDLSVAAPESVGTAHVAPDALAPVLVAGGSGDTGGTERLTPPLVESPKGADDAPVAETARPSEGTDGRPSLRAVDVREARPTERPAGERPERPERQDRQDRRGNGRDQRGRGRRDRDRSREQREPGPIIQCQGILDVLPDGFGFLRTNGYTQSDGDVYVSLSQIRRFGLRRGDHIVGAVREPKDNEKYPALLKIETVGGVDPDTARGRPIFEKLTPLFPEERLRLETEEHDTAARIMDLLCPIGKGQRGLIVSPPKAGKTTILKKIANSITTNNPDVDLMVLLVDERPEEVTDMQRSVNGEVVASTFDQPSENHVQVTELVLDRVKRLVEMKHDVVILLDSITRMARAFNLNTPASGRILSGGVDSTALYPPKKFFGAARNIEEGGSLTILATALVDTGSRMDEVIFEEFKGTGNMEIRLDRKLADKRIFPAIDIDGTGTRKEELLMEPAEATMVWKLRNVLHSLEPAAAIELLINKVRETKSNADFLLAIQKNSR
jgi:transcription termination factor Rho